MSHKKSRQKAKHPRLIVSLVPKRTIYTYSR